MTKPFFSIIIPTLNEEKFLPHLLEDLSKQSFQDFEVIVVDGKSNDKTVVNAKSYTKLLPSLKIITSEKRHVCVQRNLGAELAISEWLIFMDADNRLPSYFLQGIKYRLESDVCDIASTWIAPEKSSPPYKIVASTVNIFYETEMSLSDFPSILESMIIIKKSFFERVNGFNADVNLGEGRVIIQSVRNLGGKLEIYKDPQYTYSLRRLKNYGTLRTISALVQNELLGLIGIKAPQKGYVQKLYPMLGGGVYNSKYTINKKKVPKFLKNIQGLLKEF